MHAVELAEVSPSQRYGIAVVAFLGWMFAGVQLAVVSIVMREAVKDVLSRTANRHSEGDYGYWFGWQTAGFMFGAAAGGYLLGWAGDRWGRKRAIVWSIACYSLMSGATCWATTPLQLMLMRFFVGVGVGGMWPNGISLVSEAWPNLSRPALAGIIGAAANIGTMLFSVLTCFVYVTVDSWQWVMLLGTCPILLALLVSAWIPESPLWLALQKKIHLEQNQNMQSSDQPTGAKAYPDQLPKRSSNSPKTRRSALSQVFKPPYLRTTILGILLGTIPLFGGWGSSNWANAWASEVGESVHQVDPALKAKALLARSAPGSVASLLGGLVASWLGRRLSYCLMSLGCLGCSQYLFAYSHPSAADFLWWTAALGVFNGLYYGWLPLCLPELFPTSVRATGSGVSFNFGRIATSLGILVAAAILKEHFQGDYARIGQLTSWIYLAGVIVIWLVPTLNSSNLTDR